MKKQVHAIGPNGFGTYTFDADTVQFSDPTGTPAESIVCPGFVDVHCHGAFGIDFMSAEPDQVLELCRRLESVGYEGFLPTTVTASASELSGVIARLPQDPFILGFHLEGPFLSPKHPGAQPKNAIVAPPQGPSEWDFILDHPSMRLITLAPEITGALELTERLADRGVRVSMGHTDATFAESELGLKAGVRHATHTFNAMRPLHHRQPGSVGFVLTHDQVSAELIYDRHHVHCGAADVLIRCKPMDKIIAVSDSTMASGLASGTRLTMWGLECEVGDGQVRLLDGTLAGSAITLLDAFRNLHADFGAEIAIRTCCLNPRLILGLDPSKPNFYLELDFDLNIIKKHYSNKS
jgi:N-acetylglucosamine-6-phosphate deacetylase